MSTQLEVKNYTEGPIFMPLVKFTGLIMSTMIIQMLYGAADMLIVGGTSLVVYPAAGLVNYYRGDKLVLINKSSTPYDEEADLVLHMGLGEVFGQIEI